MLFSAIGVAAVFKKKEQKLAAVSDTPPQKSKLIAPLVPLKETSVVSVPVAASAPKAKAIEKKKEKKQGKTGSASVSLVSAAEQPLARPAPLAHDDFPNIDRIHQLFSFGSSQLPIVETVTYSSTVSWLKGRPAWVSDYAVYFGTSRHFIARGLNGRPDYFSQKVSEGSRFNVFKKEKNIQFYLLVDVSRCKMGFYYVDLDTNERVLLKTYRVGLGRLDPSKPSGTLTPLGRYSLGERVAIYKSGTMGYHLDRQVEMRKVFGTRWIPFEQELERTSASARGYGLQGAPWADNPQTGQLVESEEVIGAYDSDGCIRLAAADIEELFSIVITKPTFIEIVKNFHEAKLPGVEVAVPSR